MLCQVYAYKPTAAGSAAAAERRINRTISKIIKKSSSHLAIARACALICRNIRNIMARKWHPWECNCNPLIIVKRRFLFLALLKIRILNFTRWNIIIYPDVLSSKDNLKSKSWCPQFLKKTKQITILRREDAQGSEFCLLVLKHWVGYKLFLRFTELNLCWEKLIEMQESGKTQFINVIQ